MDEPAEFRPDRIFGALRDAGVDYVTVGAWALIGHGVVRATQDVDVVPSPAPDNLGPLAAAITVLGGVPAGEPDTRVTAELLAREANMRFHTRAGQLDVLFSSDYRRRFCDLSARSEVVDVDGVPVRIVSRNDLILLKAGTGRDRDLLDIGDLLALDA